MRVLHSGRFLAGVVLVFLAVAPASGELRVSDLEVFLNDHVVTVHTILLGAIPEGFRAGLSSGIPVHVRITLELWHYRWLLPDNLLTSTVVERTLVYNVVTKEYRVTSVRGEKQPVHATRDLRDAQRVLSEVRSTKLTPAAAVDPAAVIYVRVNAEAALNGEHTFVARMAGTAEQAVRRSDYRIIQRVQ